MPTQPSARRTPALVLVLASLLSSLALGTVTATPADAAVISGTKVVGEAARHRGAPYKWGAAGPTKFDCSGYTLYVYNRFGKKLPHSSALQYSHTRHYAMSGKKAGDLLFFRTNGKITHVAIYAGKGLMWHSPQAGSVVRLDRVYSATYLVGRP